MQVAKVFSSWNRKGRGAGRSIKPAALELLPGGLKRAQKRGARKIERGLLSCGRGYFFFRAVLLKACQGSFFSCVSWVLCEVVSLGVVLCVESRKTPEITAPT